MGLLLRTLGTLDILAAIMLLFTSLDLFPLRIVLLHAAYLIGKGVLFRGNIVSAFDLLIGVYLGVSALVGVGIAPVNMLLGIDLGVKGLFSML